MTFKLYDVATGGAAVWTEIRPSVTLTNGNFNVVLGSSISFPIPLAFDVPYWLSVEINSDGEMPRQPLTGSAYAFRALSLDGAATIAGSQVTGAVLQGGNTLGAAMSVGTQDNNTFSILAANVAAFRVLPASTPNLIGGSTANFVTAGVAAAVVSGGGYSGTIDPDTFFPCGTSCANCITDHGGSIGGGVGNQAGDAAGTTIDAAYATVGGGLSNTASNGLSTVGGGRSNTASGAFSTIGGGYGHTGSGLESTVGGGYVNTASGTASTVGGGSSNTASGGFSTVGGGAANSASGAFSFAAGNQAKTQTAGTSPVVHNGAFVWADNSALDFNSTAANEFSARATGGVRFITAINATGIPTAGVTVASGGGAWATLSDRAAKKDIIAVDSRSILDRLASMPLYTWRYIAEVSGATHMGPVAQDFRAAFGLGDSDKTITTVDADGVALAAIQGLNQKLEAEFKAKDARINRQEAQIKQQDSRILQLENALAAIQAMLGAR
jgi:hypothetical protein